MRVLKQPTSQTCGQTVLAMILDVDVATVVKAIGKAGPTPPRDLGEALDRRGYVFERARVAPRELEGIGTWIIRIGKDERASDGSAGHWLLVYNSVIYDPSLGDRYGLHVLNIAEDYAFGDGWSVKSIWKVYRRRAR